jgi:Protein of unknown function (DUF1552)
MRKSEEQRISRRSVLKSAGALLALPFLEAMLPPRAAASAAAVRPPVRLGIFSVTGGTVLEAWQPREVGRLNRLPSILRPLEFARDDVLVISGLSQSGRSEGINAHEHCAFKHLTGAELVKREGGTIYAGVSVDQAAAQVAGRQTLLPSLEVGLNLNQYSFRGPTLPVPYEANPRLVFDRMFRGRRPVVPNWSRRGQETAAPAGPSRSDDQSVIDLVREQARDLRRDLGSTDQHTLDDYLESVRSVERRIAFVEARHRQDVLDLAHPGPSRLALPAGLPREGTPGWQITRPINDDPGLSRHDSATGLDIAQVSAARLAMVYSDNYFSPRGAITTPQLR